MNEIWAVLKFEIFFRAPKHHVHVTINFCYRLVGKQLPVLLHSDDYCLEYILYVQGDHKNNL